MRSEDCSDLDRILDEALANYAAAEPRAGIEARVLNRIHSRDRWRWWWIAAPVLAAIVLAVALWIMLHPHQPPAPPVRIVRSAPPVTMPPKVLVTHLGRGLRRRPALPKRNEFPTPSPLTNEERALLTLVTQYPEEAQTEKRNSEPIEIEEIKIPPLQSDGGQ